jgi:hypothetical protein
LMLLPCNASLLLRPAACCGRITFCGPVPMSISEEFSLISLRLREVDVSCFENCRLTRVEIPRTIEHLGQSWFSNSTIGTFLFESNSQLHPTGDKIFVFLVQLEWFANHVSDIQRLTIFRLNQVRG